MLVLGRVCVTVYRLHSCLVVFVLRYIGYISVRSCLCDGKAITFVLGRVCVTVYRLH